MLSQKRTGIGRCYLTVGQIENCQVAVFMAYLSSRGQALIDRRLYLPKSWSSSAKKREKAVRPRGGFLSMGTRTKTAKIAQTTKFATKTRLAKEMLQSTFEEGLRPALFVADEVYSRDGLFWYW